MKTRELLIVKIFLVPDEQGSKNIGNKIKDFFNEGIKNGVRSWLQMKIVFSKIIGIQKNVSWIQNELGAVIVHDDWKNGWTEDLDYEKFHLEQINQRLKQAFETHSRVILLLTKEIKELVYLFNSKINKKILPELKCGQILFLKELENGEVEIKVI